MLFAGAILKKALILADFGYAKSIETAKLTGMLARNYKRGGFPCDDRINHPIAFTVASFAKGGQEWGGNMALMFTALAVTGQVVALPFTVGPLVAGIVMGGAMAIGAATHVAAPLVKDLLGTPDRDPQGPFTRFLAGMADGLLTPLSAITYAGAKVGQGLGLMAGALTGFAYAGARHSAAHACDRLLRPLPGRRPGPAPVPALAGRARYVPAPASRIDAATLGERLRARFTGMTAKAAPAATANPPGPRALTTGNRPA